MRIMNDAIPMPAELAAVATGPGWLPGTFGDSYREVGRFRIYVYPAYDMQDVFGWEVVVSYHRRRGASPAIECADLHAASAIVQRIQAAIAAMTETTE